MTYQSAHSNHGYGDIHVYTVDSSYLLHYVHGQNVGSGSSIPYPISLARDELQLTYASLLLSSTMSW
jgi:hypothetical protein